MKLRLALLLLSVGAATVPLCAQVRAPKAGIVRYRTGALHPLFGLGSSYIVGPAYSKSAVAAAFSDGFGLIADGVTLSLVDASGKAELAPLARIPCAEAAPILGIEDSADSAVAWLPSESALVVFIGHSFGRIPLFGLEPGSIVTSVSKLGPSSARLLLVRTDNTVIEAHVSLATGQVSDCRIVDAHGRAAVQSGYSFSVFDDKLHVSTLDSSNAPLDFPLNVTGAAFEQASSKSLHISSPAGDRNWIVYRENDRLAVAELPLPVVSK